MVESRMASERKVEILLADDHHIVRQGLRALLEGEPDFKLVGEASDGTEVLLLVERLKPHVVVLDIKMPGMSGIEVAREVARATQTKIVMLSMYSEEAYIAQSLRAGASAYVLKEARAGDLVHAIHEVVAGRRYLSAPLSDRTVESYLEKSSSALDPYETLSPREREV